MAHLPGAPYGATCILGKTAAVVRKHEYSHVRPAAEPLVDMPGRPSMRRGHHYFRTEPRAPWNGAYPR
jgi:hypothetical protein